MKKSVFLLSLVLMFFACKDEAKIVNTESIEIPTKVVESIIDTIIVKDVEKIVSEKSTKALMEELKAKGFSIFDYVDEKTKDTVIMQQYFMAFLKKGPIRGQPEEETAELQKEHLAHLGKMYELGYADISGPFGDDGDIRGITVYNVPTLKMADSLANADPMVKAGRLEIEIHPWWAAKGFSLR
ncbi:MAG: YciI family protein [Algibacter sp.]